MSTVKHPVNEFQFLNNLKSKYSLDKIGDDCAVLPKDVETDLLLTTDMLVEDIDFRLEWTKPEFLGHKALAVSLSDIAAMGGIPKWAMLSLGIPEGLWKTDFVDKFYAGWFALAKEFDVELVGGDVSRVPAKLVIDSIVGGEVAKGKAILRSGAKPGDAIYVTGFLGGAAGGLKILEDSTCTEFSTDKLALKQLKPASQLHTAKLLQTLDIVTSMIDVSDGLSSDLFHICHASGVGATIFAENVPIDDALFTKFNREEAFDLAIHGGEDFELLFTVDKNHIPAISSVEAACIGKITSNVGVVELVSNGVVEKLESEGFRHF